MVINQQYRPILIFVLLITVLLSGCSGEEEQSIQEEAARLVAVETITLKPDQFSDYIRITGTVEAIEDAVVSAESQGRIQQIADRGARIEKGEPIAQLDDRLIRSQYNAAKTNFRLAQNTFERLKPLHADSIISTQDFDNARAQRDQAEAQLEQAEKQLEDSEIKAPFSGRVEERFIDNGELISPGMPVVRLVNTDRVRVLAGIPERYSGEITEGTETEIHLDDATNSTLQSTITYAGNVIDPDTRTYTVEIEFANPDRLVKPDMVVDLRVKRRQLEEAIIIPRTAVLRSQDGVHVFSAVENGGEKFARLTEIETGETSGALVEVVGGLQEDHEIVISGLSNLNDGDRLNILNNETSIVRAEKLSNADRPFVSY